ncbi:hypothetical protein BKA70DRAFT_1307412 [Coprinopsis sp. MPI-PUGE-AT-0042]|nr:hypothetical protein BKA70DRAFT_1307412 [Coprinopsis sp. MPI-PUGE-AT-0042]
MEPRIHLLRSRTDDALCYRGRGTSKGAVIAAVCGTVLEVTGGVFMVERATTVWRDGIIAWIPSVAYILFLGMFYLIDNPSGE